MRFALAVICAGAVQTVAYVRTDVPALLAIVYLVFAALGAGFFAGRRAWLAGALSVFLGALLFGVWASLPLPQSGGALFDLATSETALLLGILPYAILGAIAGAVGGAIRTRLVARRR